MFVHCANHSKETVHHKALHQQGDKNVLYNSSQKDINELFILFTG